MVVGDIKAYERTWNQGICELSFYLLFYLLSKQFYAFLLALEFHPWALNIGMLVEYAHQNDKSAGI